MAENIVESIVVKLGLDANLYNSNADKAIAKNKSLNKSVGDTDKVVGAVTNTVARWFSVLASATGIIKMVDQVQQLNDKLFFLEKNLGMSSQSLQNWQGAAAAMGGSADGVTNTIKSLTMGMTDFKMMGDTTLLPFMNSLGVSMVDSQGQVRKTNDVMLDLADSFSKMDRQQAFSIATKMGIDEGTFNTLVGGRKEMEKMLAYQATMYKSGEKELQASRDLAKNRALIGEQWDSLKTAMANAIIPLFVKISAAALKMFEFFQKHIKVVQAAFVGFSTMIGIMLIPMLVNATIAALGFIAPFAPFILVIGALGAAFGLLYDDYKTWAEGGNSLFDWGKFSDYVGTAKDAVEALKNAFKGALEAYKDFSKALTDKISESATGRKFLDGVGSGTAKVMAALGSKDAQQAVAINKGGNSQDQEFTVKSGSGKKNDFVKKFLPAAQKVSKKLGVPVNALLGQWALESNWGKSITKGTGYNLGNIKAGSSWGGKTVKAYDAREKSYDPYRVYDTPEEFADDYIRLVSTSKRYKGALGAKDAKEYFTGLKKGGYATDPNYISSGVATSNSVANELRKSDSAKARSMQPKNTSNNTTVNVDNVQINTSASTMKGAGQDMANGIQNQYLQFQPSLN